MKNPILLTDATSIHSFVHDLWQTDNFKNSHEGGGFIHGLIEQFAILPRLFCESTNDRLERAHFSTWWNAMMIRADYTNPVIHDLYWLHEIYHAAHMPYIPGIAKDAFNEKMQRNELEASVCSEIQVYFEMPGLREKSFDFPIYADRYLANPDMQIMWQAHRNVQIETLRMQRRNVMVGKPEHEMDMSERWIRRFAEQNAAYALAWSDRYHEVEAHMYDFQMMAMHGLRSDAINKHLAWLEDEAARDKADHVPFRQEAELATAFYWANKQKHAAAMAQA